MNGIIVLLQRFIKVIIMKKTDFIDRYQKHWTHWQWYRKMFNISIFKYLVSWFAIVPIVYSVIEMFDLKIFELDKLLKIPISWQLLWASSFCFVIAYLLYCWKCPRFIKEYYSYAEYKKHMHSPRWLVWLSGDIVKNNHGTDLFVQRMSEKKYIKKIDAGKKINGFSQIEVLEKTTKLTFKYQNNTYVLEMPIVKKGIENENLTIIAEREIFWEIFGRFSSANKTTRLIINFFLVVSGILFSIVFSQNIIKGFKLVIHSFQ